MKRIKEFFLLKDDIFFDLLISLADCTYDCSKEFSKFVKDFEQLSIEERSEKLNIIGKYEKQGDELVRKISSELYNHFVTPIDREDIHAIASDLDNGIDIIEEVSKKIHYYRLEKIPPLMKQQADIIELQIKEIQSAIYELKKSGSITEKHSMIFELEDKADDIYEVAVSGLFIPGTDPLYVIKVKDLHDNLEKIADLNQRLAVIIEGIVIKNV